MAVSVQYPVIIFIQIIHHVTCLLPLALSAGPLWARLSWASWALVYRALVGPPGPSWAGPLWAPGALAG